MRALCPPIVCTVRVRCTADDSGFVAGLYATHDICKKLKCIVIKHSSAQFFMEASCWRSALIVYKYTAPIMQARRKRHVIVSRAQSSGKQDVIDCGPQHTYKRVKHYKKYVLTYHSFCFGFRWLLDDVSINGP
jgi:hypothetical protein